MKRTILLAISFYFCCVLLVSPQNSFAQHAEDKTKEIVPLPRGAISGIITDFNGFEWSRTFILIKMKSSDDPLIKEYSRTTMSNAQGQFTFENLPPGIYTVRANSLSEGFAYVKDNVKVTSNETTKIEAKLTYGEQCESSEGKTIELTDEDKAEIVNQILEDALIKKNIPDYNPKGKFILSTENIKPDWVKPLPKIKLNLMTPDEIQSKADNKGDFLYLSFAEFAPKGKCVLVTLENGWAKGKRSDKYYLSGGGSIFLYHKKAGKWVGEYNGGWIS